MENSEINFYKKKKILITGATGFKGSWLSLWLYMMGAKVYGIGLKPDNHNHLFYKLKLSSKIKTNIFDIRDINKLKKIFINFKPEIIFHMAAQPIVSVSYLNPLYTFDVNFRGTANILELCRNYNFVKSVVCITSDKCYENKEQSKGYKENDQLGGKDPYSASKAVAEILIRAYRESFFKKNCKIGIASVRAGNVIGGGDWSSDRLVPDCVRSLIRNKTIWLRNPNSNRPWQFVLEPLRGYLMLGKKLYFDRKNYSTAWNFGNKSKSMPSVKKIAAMIVKKWGKGKIKIIKNSKMFEHNILQLDINKAEKNLKWTPVYNVKKSVIVTTDWYKDVFVKKKDPVQTSYKQIKEYVNENTRSKA